jgi:hypothetical protein
MTMIQKQNLIGLTEQELIRYDELFNYYSNMSCVRGVSVPSFNKDTNTRELSLEYCELLESSLQKYQEVLGKYNIKN